MDKYINTNGTDKKNNYSGISWTIFQYVAAAVCLFFIGVMSSSVPSASQLGFFSHVESFRTTEPDRGQNKRKGNGQKRMYLKTIAAEIALSKIRTRLDLLSTPQSEGGKSQNV